MGLLEQVQGTLDAFGIDEETVAGILAMLEQSRSDVHDGQVRTNAEGGFGASAAGRTLSWDAGVAHAKVTEAMAAMVAGLGGYAEGLRAFREDATRTDDDAAGAMNSLRAATEQLSTPDIASATRDAHPAPPGEGS